MSVTSPATRESDHALHHGERIFNPVRFVRGGNLIDLDWLLESTSSQMPLAMDTAARLFDSGKEFWMCASRG